MRDKKNPEFSEKRKMTGEETEYIKLKVGSL